MARSYRECPACGKRALSIATRCPQCGHELIAQPVHRPARPSRNRVRPLAATAAILLVAGGSFALLMKRNAMQDNDLPATAYAGAEPPATLDSSAAAASPVLPDSAPLAGALPRVARTWTKVRAHRSARADVVAVLLPGDSVLADSLRGGWWRVALDGHVLGYVYARTLIGD